MGKGRQDRMDVISVPYRRRQVVRRRNTTRINMKEKLLKIQQEIGAIKKDSTNPHFKNRYFDINTLLAEVKPVLNKHGMVLLQGLTHINGKIALKTKLIDTESDDFIEADCPLPDCADAQKYGSAITYFRRYALTSLLALEAEDDDGNTAKSAPVSTAKIPGTSKPYPINNGIEIGF